MLQKNKRLAPMCCWAWNSSELNNSFIWKSCAGSSWTVKLGAFRHRFFFFFCLSFFLPEAQELHLYLGKHRHTPLSPIAPPPHTKSPIWTAFISLRGKRAWLAFKSVCLYEGLKLQEAWTVLMPICRRREDFGKCRRLRFFSEAWFSWTEKIAGG